MHTMRNQTQNDKGLAGVAALIVFIALVLVAAITATVILDVTGELEQQASNTGEEAEGQLSSTLQVIEVYGQVNNSGTGINSTNLTVSIAPGTDAVNLTDATIQITTKNSTGTLVASDVDSANVGDAGTFEIEPLVTENSTNNILERPQDRYRLDIDVNPTSPVVLDGDELEENEQVELVLNTGRGGSTFYEFTVPSTLSAQESTVTL